VSVNREDVPVERLPFFGEGLERHDVLRAALLLDPVPVDERGEAVQAVLRRRHGGLPRLPDVLLAVAEAAVGPPGLVGHPARQGEADGAGEALSLRPRGVLDAGRRAELRMPLEADV